MDIEEKPKSPDSEMSIFKAYTYIFKPKELESSNFSNSELKKLAINWLKLTAYSLFCGLFLLFILYQKLKKARSVSDMESATNGVLITQLVMIVGIALLFIGISHLLKNYKTH